MKANELKKISWTAEKIYDDISDLIKSNPEHYKFFIPHFIYVSESVKERIMSDGFDLTIGEWGNGMHGLIIKW